MQETTDRPGVAIFPPLLMASALLTTIALNWLWPLAITMRTSALMLGVLIGLLGLGITAWGRITMVKNGTNVSPLKPTTAIVTAGPFRFTRNPLYVGVIMLLIGISLAIGTWWGFVVFFPLLVTLHYAVILREERYLERKFGESYLKYKNAVRRYV